MLTFFRKGSVPVVLLVILAIALFAFTLIAFSASRSGTNSDIDKWVGKVEEFNVLKENAEFLDEKWEAISLTKKRYGFFGENILLVNVRD